MVTVIKEKEIMTLRQLCEKYATKWFRYIIVSEADDEYSDSKMCYVAYTADTEEELYNHPDPEFNLQSGGITSGDKIVFPLEVGGIYVHA